MRVLFLFLPAVLMAQTPPPAKTQQTQPAAPKAPVKSSTPATSTTKTGAPATKQAAPATTLTTDDQKTVYALGLLMYKNLSQFELSPAEVELVKKALSDAAAGKPAIEADPWMPKIQTLAQSRAKAASAGFLAKAATEPGATKMASGLIYRDLKAGTGASPKATDTVTVHYRGTLTNGTEFDSSYKRNQPMPIGLNQVIPCWTEGVQKMKVGGKAKLVCPSGIAYGDAGRPPTIPGGATLVFEIELLEIGAAGH
jgi:FKBP-type peptidyl-prolyl cis-trans isomerase FkpA